MQLNQWVNERLASLSQGAGWQPNATTGLARFRERRDLGAGRERSRIWAAAVAMTACLALIALPAPRALAQRCLNCSVALWQNLSTPAIVRVAVKPEKDRKIAPDFTLKDATGQPVKLSDFRGKVVLLNFWATWCGGCKVEIPWFMEFQQTYQDRDFVVLGVSFDEDGWKSVKPYMEQKKINYRVMIGTQDVATLYGGVEALPVTYIIDKSGRIAATHVGLINKSDYKTEIETLLSAEAVRRRAPSA